MRRLATAILGTTLFCASAAVAAEAPKLTIKDHKFEPQSIELPAGERVKLTITNSDGTAEEFESHDLHVEKMIAPGATVSVVVGPLKPGTYKFFGELNEDTAQGTIVVK